MPVNIHDRLFGTLAVDYHPHAYSLLSFAVALSLQTLACVFATRRRGRHSAAPMELFSGLTVSTICSFTYVIRGTFWARQTWATAIMCAWGIRLSVYLYSRVTQEASLSPNDICFPRYLIVDLHAFLILYI